MNGVPDKIYLQASPDADAFNELVEVTWCSDPIEKTDITYISYARYQALAREVHELRICTPLEYQQKADRRLAERGVTPDPLWESHGRLLEALKGACEALSIAYWTSDDGKNIRQGVVDDYGLPTRIKQLWEPAEQAITAAEQLTKGDA